MDVSRDEYGYSRLVGELWAAGESFLIVEHDIEVNARAVRQARHCACWWSVSPYHGPGTSFLTSSVLKVALGCTRFRAPLLAAFDAANRAALIADGGSVVRPGHWKRVDARLYGVLRDAGYRPHVHAEVAHHHAYGYGCACGGACGG